MRKILLTLVAAGVLFGVATASNALTVWSQTISPGSLGYPLHDWLAPNWIWDDTNTQMNTILGPTPLTAYDATPLATATFGTIFTLPRTAATVKFTNVEAWYALQIHTGGDATLHNVLVKGKINGTYTYDGTNFGGGGSWECYELYDLFTSTAYTVPTPNPNPAHISSLYDPMIFSDGPVNLYVERFRDIPSSFFETNQTTGVFSTVPEPSALAMLFGSGVVGSLMVWRRRRNVA